MARVSSFDPLDKFRFAVLIEGFTKSGFASCEAPSITINTKSYPEGGAHLYPRKIVDSVEYSTVTLTRGVTQDQSFHNWAIQFMEIVRGFKEEEKVKRSLLPIADALGKEIRRNDPQEYRREVRIEHLDRQGRVVKTYVLYNAFPIEYKPASDFAADGDDVLSIEKLVLTYESFEVVPTKQDTNPADIRDITKRLIKRSF
jgi:phage tail-like protein